MAFLFEQNLAVLPSFRNQIDRSKIIELNPETIAVPLVHGEMDVKAVVAVGDKIKVGQLLGLKNRPDFYFPLFSPVSGEVIAVVKKQSTKLRPCEYLVIKNDFEYKSIPLAKSISLEDSREDIVDYIRYVGIQEEKELGYQKYDCQCDTLVVSLLEDDPYLVSDVAFAEDYIEEFNLGIALVKKVCGAKKVMVVSNTACPFTGKLDDAENKVLTAVYPLNEEEILKETLQLKDMLKVDGTAVVRLGLAASNKSSMTFQYVTVAGDSIQSPSLVKCPMGTSCGDLLLACNCTDGVHNLLIGGPMTGVSVTTAEVAISQVTNEVTVFPHEDVVSEPCIHCGKCTLHCPKGLLPTEVVTALKTSDVDLMTKLDINECIECGLCTYVCPSNIAITESIRRAKKYYSLRRKK